MLPSSHKLAVGEARPELADIFRRYGESYQRTHRISSSQQKVMRAVSVCRTQELGGHLDRCDACGFERPAYNSCRNRHCPKCQALAKARWLEKQTSELLPVGYLHLVFTLPHELNGLILTHLKLAPALPQSPIVSAKDLLLKITGIDLSRCPCCQKGTMIVVGDLIPILNSSRWDSS